MTESIPRVGILVVNWNGARDTLACLRSLESLRHDSFRVYLLDNGSTDDSDHLLTDYLATSALPVSYEAHDKNLGFAGGNNFLARRALSDGARFLWLLNNDTEVDPSALEALEAAATSGDSIGFVGSRIFFFDNPVLLWYAGASIDRWSGRARVRGFRERDCGQYSRLERTGYATGCSLLVRREVIGQVGLMSEDYFLYYEEADWALRASRVGWESWYQPESRVYHRVSSATRGRKGNDPVLIYYNIRNRFVMMQRIGDAMQRTTSVLYLAHQMWSQYRLILRRNYSRRAAFAYLHSGIIHGLVRRMGPAPGRIRSLMVSTGK